ncbi:MAG: AraC family transcriptional regulator [Bernardetiaceae bacterium]|jgi:AraC-like DNA-binding protein|nr:AraC family transcriptional regulator [Bernardetiaceae bacterium]
MKTQFEQIVPGANSSFRWLVNPRLNDFFYWHFHPEVELVLIEAPEGTRHVGEHLSRFRGGDWVLIGPYIPHLNFDYGIRTAYLKTVLHIRPGFLGQALGQTPELAGIQALLERARLGVAFGAATRQQWGPQFKALPGLPPLEQLLGVLHLLAQLAQAPDAELLHLQPPQNPYNKKEQSRLQKLYSFIDAHYARKIGLDEAAQVCHLGKAAFCRYFKKMTRLTFTEFLNHYRINEAKRQLLLDHNVTEVCFATGFESLSYFNRTFRKITGENPLAFKKRFSRAGE